MIEASTGQEHAGTARTLWHYREPCADWLAVGVALALPWSTSAAGIFIALWLVARLSLLDIDAVRREVTTAAGGLPILLWLLAALGTLWADVGWHERLAGLGGFHRLLLVPLLIAQFRRSSHGRWVLYAYLASVLAVMLVSWSLVIDPNLPWRGKFAGVPVKDYIIQGTEFLICAFALLGAALTDFDAKAWRTKSLSAALAVLLLANTFFVASGRTALLVAPALGLCLGWRIARWKGLMGAIVLACFVGAAVCLTSPYLRERFAHSISELRAYRDRDASSSTALHIEFLKKSVQFIATAPAIGHGTGSITAQFRGAAVSGGDAAAAVTDNPHNQIFTVAIQLGVVGAGILLAMWLAHFMLFQANGLAAWFGTIIVVESVVSSLVNSTLFNFTEGWLYVFGVGVCGGMVLRGRDRDRAATVAR